MALTQYDYGARIYNPGIARFLSVDPLSSEFPWNSTYAFAENDVIRSIDLEGLEKLIVTKESSQIYNQFFKIARSDEVLKKAVWDPIHKSELRDKIHIYFVQVEHFGYGLGGAPDGRNIKGSVVEKQINAIVDYDNGNKGKYYSDEIRSNKKFYEDAGLDIETLKKKIDAGINVFIVAVEEKGKGEEDLYESILHEVYLHLTKFENSNNKADHIDGHGAEYYEKSGESPSYSPNLEDVPNSKMGKMWRRFKENWKEHKNEKK
ncbi:RHS repeat domain-containing protein [Fulvivirga sediminis]|uniref:RHS repeat domain-containing protein n=1 Tax=Fulvivirga sediminis TaxID=2803949 RepID=UPI001F22B85D|nr:RHS repeat-associated core domain-containing protein [Fulvivirga sediminis]